MTLTTERPVAKKTTVDITQARPGDVLLSFGEGKLPELVRLFDGGDYSHASLCKDQSLIEAGLSGVVSYPMQKLVADQQYVDLYRFVSDHDEIMGAENWPSKPVVEVAEGYLQAGTTYANNQLYLAGALVLTRKIPLGELAKAATRALMAALFKALTRIKAGETRRSLVCSELVYRSFYEALPEKKYGLSISGTLRPRQTVDQERAVNVPDDAAFIAQLNAELSRLPTFGTQNFESGNKELAEFKQKSPEAQLKNLRALFEELEMASGSGPMMEANPLVAAGMVSPRDLQKSPNLRLLGRIKKANSGG